MSVRVRNAILIVDDMISNRIFLRNILKQDYEVLEAGNGEVALQMLQRHHTKIAAVLLDLMMPVKDGRQTLDEMGKLGYLEEFPVLVVTADFDTRNEAQVLEMGASDMIHKPFDPAVIKRRISNLVALFTDRKKMENKVDDLARILDASNMDMVSVLATVTEFRSLESGQHTLRIKSFTEILLKAVAEHFPEYELSQRDIDVISNAAILHDVGKVMIPDSILGKPGKLTQEEFEIMKTHTTAGCAILDKMTGMLDEEFMRYAYNICRYHHERWDGRGYPDGLMQDNIPLCAQVVGICDVYDALTTPRVYKEAFSHDTAVHMILDGECGVFNPQMLQCLCCVLNEFESCARAYADSPTGPKTDTIRVPEPISTASILNEQAEKLSTAKYHALFRIVNGIVIEIDMDTNTYNLVYDADGTFSEFRTGHDLNELVTTFLNTAVHPDDRVIATKHLLSLQKDFFEAGLRRQTRRYRIRSSAMEEYYWVDVSHLRVYTKKPKEKKALCVLQKVEPERTETGDVISRELTCDRQLKKLPWVILRCRQDRWMSIEDGMENLSRLVGYSISELQHIYQGRLIELILPEDQEMVYSSLQKAREHKTFADVEYRLRHKDGSVIWVTDKNKIKMGADGEEHVYRILLDNTKVRKELQEIRMKLERQQLLLNNASEIFFEWDLEKDEIYVTENFEDTFGYAVEKGNFTDYLLRNHGLIYADDLPVLQSLIDRIDSGSRVAEQEMRIMKADGTCVWCRVRVAAQQWENGHIVSILGAITNIHADKLVMQNLQYQMERDSLTGLFNRTAATKQIEQYIQSENASQKAAVLTLDIDNFKRVNDTYGHMAGDSVLISCGEAIRCQFRSEDIVARFGGDEFLIFLPGIPNQKIAQNCCQKILDCFTKDVASLVPNCQISCSIGIAMYPEDGTRCLQLLQNADTALRYAKESGKNRWVTYADVDVKQAVYTSDRTEIESNDCPNFSDHGLIEYTLRNLYQSGDAEKDLYKILGLIGRQINASRVYIFEGSDDKKGGNYTLEWCNDGITSVKELQKGMDCEVSLKQWDSYYEQSNIFYCRKVSGLPEDAKRIMQTYGVKSFVHCAIRGDKGELRGFVGFSDCLINRLWTKEQLNVLESFAEVLSLYLLRKRAQDDAKRWEDNFVQMLNESDECIYAVEEGTYKIKFMNARMRKLMPQLQLEQKCYEGIMNSSSICEQCPIKKMNLGQTVPKEMDNDGFPKCFMAQMNKPFWDGEDVILITYKAGDTQAQFDGET